MNANESNTALANLKSLYAIRDNKIGEFNPPCIFANHAAAIRAFSDMVTNDKQTLVSLHPEDFQLYFLGSIVAETGAFVQPVPPLALAVGSDFVKGN